MYQKRTRSFAPFLPISPSVSESSKDVEIPKLSTNITEETDKLRSDEQKSLRKHGESFPSSSGSLFVLSTRFNRSKLCVQQNAKSAKKRVETERNVFRTVKKKSAEALDCRTYQPSKKSSNYNETDSI